MIRMESMVHLSLLALLIGNVAAELACKDEQGKDVDWFIAIKMPSMRGYESVHPDISTGLAFYYADSNNQNFRISKANINDTKSAIGYTISQAIQLYEKKPNDTLYAFYNDQPPAIMLNGKPTKEEQLGHRAHAKGVMAFNNKQGFWFIHSAPRYVDPTTGKGYFYPKNAAKKGQSFFCATFLSDQLKELSIQNFYNHFGYYVAEVPVSMSHKFPRLYHALKMDKSVDTKCPYHRTTTMRTKGGEFLTNFAKNDATQADLWANQVTAEKKQSFFVQTWLNGLRDWQNVCKSKSNLFTKNVRTVKYQLGGIKWKSSKDHSKWAVSDTPKTVCIGDINRQLSQSNRGGGCICIDNEKIWKFFRDSVDAVECCPGVDASKEQCHPMPCDSVEVPETNRKPGDAKRDWSNIIRNPIKCDQPADEDEDDEDEPVKAAPVRRQRSNVRNGV